MNVLFRAVFVTVLLVPFWRWLYPLIFQTVSEMPIDVNRVYGIFPLWLITSTFFQHFAFFFMTLWKFRFLLAGWSTEVELLRLERLAIATSFIRWIICAVGLLLLAPALSVLMLHLLSRYTPVPQWITQLTTWMVFVVFLHLGWMFPEDQVNRFRRAGF